MVDASFHQFQCGGTSTQSWLRKCSPLHNAGRDDWRVSHKGKSHQRSGNVCIAALLRVEANSEPGEVARELTRSLSLPDRSGERVRPGARRFGSPS